MHNSNDDLHDLPSFAPDSDELKARQQSMSNDLLMDAPVGRGGNSGLVWVLLVLVLGVGGAAGYLYSELLKSNDRITTLETRLSQAGESMDQSSATIGLRLKELTDKTNELWEQMDKLWASAWRKNQSEIAKLRDDIKDINKQSTSFKSSLSALQTAVKGMPELERRVAELGALQAQIDKAVASAAGMTSKVSSLEASVARSAGAQKDFEKRIATNEQWVESINAYRKQVNRRLEELQKLIAPSTPSAQPSLN